MRIRFTRIITEDFEVEEKDGKKLLKLGRSKNQFDHDDLFDCYISMKGGAESEVLRVKRIDE